MTSSEPKPKGILKKSQPSNNTINPTPPPSSSPPQNMARAEAERVALQHANIIQQQKDLQVAVFEAVGALLELPRLRRPASRPSPRDVAEFKDLIRPFQPGDYDDLVEERSIAGLCGYALCPKARRSYPRGGRFKLVNLNREDFDIVRVADLEKWCSDACARRATYIKVQLHETPAWERVVLPHLTIELLDESVVPGSENIDDGADNNDDDSRMAGADTAAKTADDPNGAKLEREQIALKNSAALALERGDNARDSAGGAVLNLAIREKTVTSEPKPPGV